MKKEESKNKPNLRKQEEEKEKEKEPEIISINKNISDIVISKEREENNNNDDDNTQQVGENVNGYIFLGPSEYLSASMKWETIFGFIVDGHLHLYNDENMRDLVKYKKL